MIINIKNDELIALNGAKSPDFPKYTSQLINWANQNAQGTRPKVVGKLSDLFPEFEDETDDVTISKWKEWYIAKYPDAVNEATEKIWKQVENLKDAIAGEEYEETEMYVKFAKEAREEGFEEIAKLFEEVGKIEAEHEKRYRKLLDNLEKGIVFKGDGVTVWKCRNCGYIHIGDSAPEECPVCKHPQAYFEIQAENY